MSDFLIEEDVLIKYRGSGADVVIPDGVTEIAHSAFYMQTHIRSVVIPEGVYTIGIDAFFGCQNLARIALPSTLVRIYPSAFYRCHALTDVVLPQGVGEARLERLWEIAYQSVLREALAVTMLVKYWDVVEHSKLWQSRIKLYKKAIIEKAMSADMADVLSRLFALYRTMSVDNLDSLIAQAENKINIKAFLIDYKNKRYSTEKLEEIEGIRVEKELGLRERTLADWRKIFKLYKPKDSKDEIHVIGYRGDAADVVIPQKIGKYNVVSVGFATCEGRDRVRSVVIADGVTQLSPYAFSGCCNMTSIVIPPSVSKIGTRAFGGCRMLESVTIPDGVTRIDYGTFVGCESLTDVVLPASVREINPHVFDYCDKLTIHAPQGSYAEQYARENNIKFVAE